jgi:hypothetical protein
MIRHHRTENNPAGCNYSGPAEEFNLINQRTAAVFNPSQVTVAIVCTLLTSNVL